MVQAIVEGTKTQTRRIVQNAVEIAENPNALGWFINELGEAIACPYGKIGDVLWVRENFQYRFEDKNQPAYAADFNYPLVSRIKWKPSIHMPKSACRIFLRITNIRVQRLQNISQEDAIAEGIIDYEDGTYKNYFTKKGLRDIDGVECLAPIASFQSLFCNINGIALWDQNPYVWVIEFDRIPKPENFG
jgi:hypothetical protein